MTRLDDDGESEEDANGETDDTGAIGRSRERDNGGVGHADALGRSLPRHLRSHHLGHLDIITRATKVVDKLVIAPPGNVGKGPLFSVDERVEMVRDAVTEVETNGAEIVVHSFDTPCWSNFAEEMGAQIVIRGLRAVSDFEYEFQMASMNARLNDSIETVFLTASERQQFISSHFVKEIGKLGGDVSSFVTPRVAERLRERFAQRAKD